MNWGRERERYKAPYGSSILVADGTEVTQVKPLVNGITYPSIITEVSGTARFKITDGLTATMKIDEATGMSSYEILATKDRPSSGKDLRPAIIPWYQRG